MKIPTFAQGKGLGELMPIEDYWLTFGIISKPVFPSSPVKRVATITYSMSMQEKVLKIESLLKHTFPATAKA